MSTLQIVPVRGADDLKALAGLFRAYAASLPIDLAYQDFEAEMAAMPGKYAPPRGELFLARDAGGLAFGCVGLRPFDAGRCEMKRLYIVPEGRGTGAGEALARKVIGAARQAGYAEILLDTLPSMAGAQALYRRLGFVETQPYYDTPIEGTIFMRLDLRA